MEIKRIFDLLPYQLDNYPKSDCLSYKEAGIWKPISTSELIDFSDKIALALYQKGIRKGDKVAIISANRPEWMFADFGIQKVGAVSVPMYPTITEQDYNFIFKDADVKIIFVSNIELKQKVDRALSDVSGVEAIYTFDKIEGAAHWTQLCEDANENNRSEILKIQESTTGDDLLTLIYTSGTTGNPKGVMLTHNNLVSNFTDSAPIVPVDHTARALSFLPLCHIFERMVTYLYFRVGISIYYAENFDTIGENIKEVKPQLFTCVPRLLEKVYDKIVAKGSELSGIKRILFFWALNLGLKYDTQKNLGVFYNLQLFIARALIFKKWKESLGGNLVAIVSGGAALQPRLARVFWAAGFKVMEGYGLTETSPVIAVNLPDKENCYIGTVGLVIPNVTVKIAEDGEILCKGPNIMKGYYKRPDLTAEVFDSEGWFKTGDIGEFVEGKFLKITDRKRELLKTSGGKFIAPQPIENKLKESLFIEQVMVVGEGQKYAAALIVPNLQAVMDYAQHKNIQFKDSTDVLSNAGILEKFQREIDKINENFAQFEKLKKFRLLKNLWSIESGELTAKLSLKRKVISKKFEKEIAEMYES